MRAFAVTIVLLFHLDPTWVPWGFLGVDLFFSLSGFLMAWLVLQEMEAGKPFSGWRFLVRRFWRIFPALAITILASLVAAFFLFSPDHLERAAESSLAALFALSNLYFLGEEGYFDVASAYKPLLHTWSLGVEEQFYLGFALVISFLGARRLLPVLAVAGGISVLLFAYAALAQSWHDDPASALFFLPQYRIYQFAAGGIVAVVVFKSVQGSVLSETCGFAILGIGFAMVALTESAVFAPVVCSAGMGLLLLQSRLLDRIAEVAFVSYLSRTSYQIYLVHWPIIVYYQYVSLEPLDGLGIVVCGTLSLVLGHALYVMTDPLRTGSK